MAKKKEQDATTCGAEPLTIVEWEKLSSYDDPRKRVRITVCFDMGCRLCEDGDNVKKPNLPNCGVGKDA
eukprot:5493367-Ditylum_brightwellii.AAC.1